MKGGFRDPQVPQGLEIVLGDPSRRRQRGLGSLKPRRRPRLSMLGRNSSHCLPERRPKYPGRCRRSVSSSPRGGTGANEAKMQFQKKEAGHLLERHQWRDLPLRLLVRFFTCTGAGASRPSSLEIRGGMRDESAGKLTLSIATSRPSQTRQQQVNECVGSQLGSLPR